MGVRVGHRPNGIKPRLWSINKSLVDPNWRWAWDDLDICYPFWKWWWEGAPQNLGVRQSVTATGSPFWPTGPTHTAVGTALSYNGSDQAISLSEYPYDNDDFTVLALFRTVVTTDMALVAAGNSADNNEHWLLHLNYNVTADQHQFKWRSNSGEYSSNIGSLPLDDGAWHCMAGRREGNVITMFLDGIQYTSDTTANTIAVDSLNIGRLVRASPSNYFNGDIALVSMWTRAVPDVGLRMLTSDPFGFLHRMRQQPRFVPVVGGLSIPIAMHHYQHQLD